jgi:dipeptidyl aminopeptidase/acylaminoacyl peptidase
MPEVGVSQNIPLVDDLVDRWGSWGPVMTPDATRVAFISDRSGVPELWIQDLVATGEPPEPTRIKLSDDPVLQVHWAADSQWLACLVATGGGMRTQAWVVRPDGTGARRIAGSPEVHAEVGPWTRSGHRVVVTIPSSEAGQPTECYLADPATGQLDPLATGDLIHVLDLSVEERLAVLLDGARGHQFCVVVDRLTDTVHELLPRTSTGSTETALLRAAPDGAPDPLVVYLATDAGLPRQQLLSVPIGPHNWPQAGAEILASRDDAELEALDADDTGRLLLLVWNVSGSSEIELFDTATRTRIPVPRLPGLVASSPVLSRDGSSVVLTVEGPERPRELWQLQTGKLEWRRVTGVPFQPEVSLVVPTLERFTATDGTRLTGWLYRVPGRTEPGPAVVTLHGGPEAQERPTFSAEHQAMAAAGMAVFAPNVRGSSGFGKAFVHADDIHNRKGAFADVIDSAKFLVDAGVGEPERIAVSGRSYGGYLVLASLAFSPGVFAAGIDICGMSDLRTFYRDTEPWIAAAAVTKYGDPERDAELLAEISPLRSADYISVPVMVVHGELDTNVPIGESLQLVDALRRRSAPVRYVELPGEGHEYRRAESRKTLIRAMLEFLSETLTG